MVDARVSWSRTVGSLAAHGRVLGALLRTACRPHSTAPSPAPVAAPEPADLVRAYIDDPFDGRPLPAARHVLSGWAFHRGRPLRGVVVTLDGLVVGATSSWVERTDVAAAYPRSAKAGRSGWTLEVDLQGCAGREVELRVHAVVGGRGGGPAQPWVLAASATVPVLGRPPVGGPGEGVVGLLDGCFVESGSLSTGYQRVYGLAEAPGGVSWVEVSCEGVVVGRARTALPGRLYGSVQGPESALALFEIVVDVPPGLEHVELSGVAHSCRGEIFALRSWRAPVSTPVPVALDIERVTVVRDRHDELLGRMRAHLLVDQGHERDGERDGPRVLVVTHDLGLGGGQLYLQELLRRLHALGVRGAVVSPTGGVLVDELEQLGFPVLVTGPVDPHQVEAYEAQVLQIATWALQHGCRVALANTMSAHAGADAAHRIGLGLVWAIHESFPFRQFWTEAYHPPFPAYVAERAGEALAAASRVVFEAAPTLGQYVPPATEEAALVVPYGVDVADIDDYRTRNDRLTIRRRLGFADSTLVVLCLGTTEPRKAQINLAQAFAASVELADADVALVMVGAPEHSPYADALRTAVETFGEDRIRIEPVQPDTYQWYHAADVLACASDVESLPRSMLEAMAFGRPVASTAVFGIPDLVDDGTSGFLCAPRDLLGLRRMLERVARTPREDLVAMGETARSKVLRDHDPNVYARFFRDELARLSLPAVD